MKEQEIKDILEKQREFFRSGETISVEFRSPSPYGTVLIRIESAQVAGSY